MFNTLTRVARAGAWLVPLSLLLGCSASAPKPSSTPTACGARHDRNGSTSVCPALGEPLKRDAANDVFAKAHVTAAPSLFQRTALLDAGSINTAVLEQLVKQRLSQVENAALNDLLKQAADMVGAEPVTDLLQAISALVVSLTDGDARSQTLTSALLRDGVSLGIALLAYKGVLRTGGCGGPPAPADDKATNWKTIVTLSDGAYEGLALSTTFHSLGFPVATGKAPEGCAPFATGVAKLVDTISSLGLDVTAAETLAASLSAAKVACARPVAAGQPDPKAPINVQMLLRQIPDAAVDSVPLSTLAELQTAVANAKISYMNTVGAAAAQDAAPALVCYGALNAVASQSAALTANLNTAKSLTLADVKSALGILTSMKVPSIDSLASQQDIQLVRTIGSEIIQQKPLQPGDIISLLKWIQTVWQGESVYVKSDVARDIISATLDLLPQAVRTDATTPAGVRLDVPALAATAVNKYGNETRPGLYARATIGAGYVAQQASGVNRFGPSFYEELGAGYRWGGTKVLYGPHLAASGLLYDVTSQQGTQNSAFAGVGFSVNLYQLLDVSVTTGAMADVGATGVSDWRWALFAGLQLPLLDYINALTSPGTTEAQTTTTSTTK